MLYTHIMVWTIRCCGEVEAEEGEGAEEDGAMG